MLTIERLKRFHVFADTPQADLLELTRCEKIVSQRLRNRTEKLIDSWAEAFDVNQL